MLCTIIWDIYGREDRRSVHEALNNLLARGSDDWSRAGVYAYWDPETREILYVGLASDLPTRFAQHNGLTHHSGGNKWPTIQDWFQGNAHLGFSILIQAAAVVLLERLGELDFTLGANAVAITEVAEGQLIELARLRNGARPPWNAIGGATSGSRWAHSGATGVIGLLSAAESSLFVARRTLRELVRDPDAAAFEALLHAARMRHLFEISDTDDAELDDDQRVAAIMEMLLLRDGKLVDDLRNADLEIRAWVTRLADSGAQRRLRETYMEGLKDMLAHNPDRPRALEFIGAMMALDGDDETADIAAKVIEARYLDQEPDLAALT